MPKSDGSIVFSTTLDNRDLEAKLKQTKNEINKLEKELEGANKEKLDLAAQLVEADKACKEVEADIERLKARVEELNEAEAMGAITPEEAKGRISAVTEELEAQQAKYNAMLDDTHKLAQSYKDSEKRVSDLGGRLEAARKKSASLGKEYAATYKNGLDGMSGAFVAMDKQFTGIANKITKRLKKLFMFSFIFGALSALKSYVVDAVKENDRFKASVDNMHAVLKGIAAPAINALIPVLTGLVTIITKTLLTFARMVDAIFNTNIMASIQAAQKAAQASTAEAEATDKQTKATNKLAKAKKAALRWMAAFDELNVIDSQNQDDTSDSLDDAANSTPTEQPLNWDALDVGKIDAKLAEIMFVLGAALLAVGVILAFSGINIPLGLALMAIGALMIYSVVSENWEQLPEETKKALTVMLGIVGAFLAVIGVILCLSGNIPLGIGMIVAGAALLAIAVGLNWEELPTEVKSALLDLLGIIAPLMAVLGVILCIMGHIPLGMMLIIAGIAIFAAKQVMTDDTLAEATVKKKLSAMLEIIIPLVVVIGVILCIFGQFVPGIALILGGFAALAVKELALDDEAGEKTTEEKLSSLLETIGNYLVVIGVILCIFGVFPLGIAAIVAGIAALSISAETAGESIEGKIKGTFDGILNFIKENTWAVLVLGIVALVLGNPIIGLACIAVGAWALVSPETLNTDWIIDKVKEIWNTVKQFWHDNIEPIFTAEWWQDKFRSIANGLISALNGALSGAGDFMNNLMGGFTSVLNWFGISGSWSISMPQIPYLAQGAVIPPNREFMAVLGDQTSGNNIETPEALMRQIVREESGNGLEVDLLQQILQAIQGGQVITCDGYTLAKVVNERNAVRSRIYGA